MVRSAVTSSADRVWLLPAGSVGVVATVAATGAVDETLDAGAAAVAVGVGPTLVLPLWHPAASSTAPATTAGAHLTVPPGPRPPDGPASPGRCGRGRWRR